MIGHVQIPCRVRRHSRRLIEICHQRMIAIPVVRIRRRPHHRHQRQRRLVDRHFPHPVVGLVGDVERVPSQVQMARRVQLRPHPALRRGLIQLVSVVAPRPAGNSSDQHQLLGCSRLRRRLPKLPHPVPVVAHIHIIGRRIHRHAVHRSDVHRVGVQPCRRHRQSAIGAPRDRRQAAGHRNHSRLSAAAGRVRPRLRVAERRRRRRRHHELPVEARIGDSVDEHRLANHDPRCRSHRRRHHVAGARDRRHCRSRRLHLPHPPVALIGNVQTAVPSYRHLLRVVQISCPRRAIRSRCLTPRPGDYRDRASRRHPVDHLLALRRDVHISRTVHRHPARPDRRRHRRRSLRQRPRRIAIRAITGDRRHHPVEQSPHPVVVQVGHVDRPVGSHRHVHRRVQLHVRHGRLSHQIEESLRVGGVLRNRNRRRRPDRAQYGAGRGARHIYAGSRVRAAAHLRAPALHRQLHRHRPSRRPCRRQGHRLTPPHAGRRIRYDVEVTVDPQHRCRHRRHCNRRRGRAGRERRPRRLHLQPAVAHRRRIHVERLRRRVVRYSKRRQHHPQHRRRGRH